MKCLFLFSKTFKNDGDISVSIMHFGSTAGFLALLSLVPLIILYLIRPNPKIMNIPSLMFFIRSSGSKRVSSFFRYFTKDWLFLIQFFLVLALAMAFTQPATFYQLDVAAQNTVLVIDVSASSQTLEGARTRFDIARSKAIDSLGSSNSIILAKNVPFLALKDASYSEAKDFLESLEPKETETNLGEAIILAGEVLSGREGRVIVFSDFINTGGQDPETAKLILQSKGLVVDFINTFKEKRNNIGIVDISVDEEMTTIYVKNFNDKQEKVDLNIGSLAKSLSIPAKGTESVSVKTPSDITKITLSPKDDFDVDNVAYISGPSGDKVKVALISNNPSVFLTNALEASGEVDLKIIKPPIMPEDDFDVYVVADIDKSKLLSGTFKDLKKRMADGAAFIFCAQEDSEEIDYDFLPVKLSGRKDGGKVVVEQLNKFTKNIDFGNVQYLLNAENKEGTVIASAVDTPLVVAKQMGAGKSVYFGFLEKGSDFKFSTGYPIFWTELIKFLTDRMDVRSLNFKTGEMLLLDNKQSVKTPHKKLTTAALLLDEQGVYELEDRKVVANLLSEKESEINPVNIIGTKSKSYELKPVKEQRERQLAVFLLIFVLVMSFVELVYIKVRGDL
ncbi:hypothetical protein DRJ25_01630 [Candidatus Woesearchaeota archaeon]|nr:MAG: hypothetical protein DRJ25_01630 [Candidatus Woesearchaeota archaeon]